MKKISVIVEKTETGFSAHSQKFPVYTTGTGMNELALNMRDALNFYFDEIGERLITQKDLDLIFSIPSLFRLYPINVKHFAKLIGMNYTLLAQYVQGRKKPSVKQLEKIIDGLKAIGKDLSQVKLT